MQQRTRQRRFLSHPVAVSAYLLVGGMTKVEHTEQFGGARPNLGPIHAAQLAEMANEFTGGESIEKVQWVWHHSEQAANCDGLSPCVVPANPDLPCIGSLQARCHSQRRGFTRTVWPNQSAETANWNV